MQKISFQNSRNQTMVGFVLPGHLQTPIILCHGYAETKEEQDIFPVIAKTINRAGYPVFSFDFAGSGESDFQVVTQESEVEDLKDILIFLQSNGYKEAALMGHSMGGAICAKSYNINLNPIKIKTMILWAAPTNSMSDFWEKVYSKEQLEELNSTGKLTIQTPRAMYMDSLTIGKEFIQESKDLNPEKLISPIECPILFIHGDEDRVVPLNHSTNAMIYANSESELVTLKGASHNCENHIEELSDITVDWLNQFLLK